MEESDFMDAEELIEKLEEEGIPFVILEVDLVLEEQGWQEEAEDEMWAYLMGVRETDEELAHSTLIFGESGAPNYFRCPVDLSGLIRRRKAVFKLNFLKNEGRVRKEVKIMSELTFGKIKRGFTMSLDKKMMEMGIVPKYTEITAYLISITFALLLITNSEFRGGISNFLIEEMGVWSLLSGIAILIGVTLSIYNAFENRIITSGEKYLILFTIILINFFVAFYAGTYILERTQGWLVIFPLLNILNAAFLLFLFRIGAFTERSFSDQQAKREEVILGTIFLLIIFLISQYVFNNYWAITFSICLVYATNLLDLSDKIIIKNLLKK
jgi:hypothetical protein